MKRFVQEVAMTARALLALAALGVPGAGPAVAEESPPAPAAAAAVTAGGNGFGLRSADGEFELRLRGLLQTDGRFSFGDDERPAADTFLIRRARPILEGTVWKIVDFRLMPDYGGGNATLLDAFVDLRFARALKLRAGKAKVPVGLEALAEDATLPFVERGLPSLLVPSRDVGVQASGELAGGAFLYAAGLFNGAADGASADSDGGDGKELAARLVFRPWRAGARAGALDVGLGLAASSGSARGTPATANVATYKTPGQQTFLAYRADGTASGTVVADGRRARLAPQAWLRTGAFLAYAEWTESRQEVRIGEASTELGHRAWQVTGSWALTGEALTERGLEPAHPAGAGGGRGAFLLSLRAGAFTADAGAFPRFADPERSARRAENAGASFAWIPWRALKLVVDGEWTRFAGGARGGDRESERVATVRLQLAF